jgi:hypothetical protein
MSPQEKEQLVTLLSGAQHWCQGAEARDARGQAVAYSDAGATAWDLTGAACHLFGLSRACELSVQIDRDLHGRGAAVTDGDSEVTAMVALQTWNDDARTTHGELLLRLQSLPARAGSGNGPRRPAGDGMPERTER